jgi:MFS superfamily sulfate permease-like transporter
LGALVSVAVAIPLAVGYGMFAFTALGDKYFAYGALAGLYAAAAVGVVCVVLGDRSTTVYAPRVTTTFLLGALLYHLVHSDAEILHPVKRTAQKSFQLLLCSAGRSSRDLILCSLECRFP